MDRYVSPINHPDQVRMLCLLQFIGFHMRVRAYQPINQAYQSIYWVHQPTHLNMDRMSRF